MNKVLLLAFCILLCKIVKAEKKVVCYYGTWATYRPGNLQFNVEHIRSELCTHLIYSFFGVNEEGSIRVLDPYLDLESNWGRGYIAKFNALKTDNPDLKTLAAVGGWNEGSHGFSEIARDPVRRVRFAEKAAEFCLEHGFDGLDLDWEYPAQRDGEPLIDKDNHLLLLKELSVKFVQKGLLLTAAVASAEFSASVSYDIGNIHQYLDFINIMTYDLHGSWDETIGINAPMYESSADVTEKEKQLNVHASINYWLQQGTPKEKIILGIPLYGRTFTLADNSKTTVGSAHVGPGTAGAIQDGFIGFNEICQKQLSENWSIQWQSEQLTPYTFLNDQWIGYDDVKSVTIKSHYALDAGLGGVMVWSVETDDIRGNCGSGEYPLLTAINGVMREGVSPNPTTDTTQALSSTTTSAPITTAFPTTISPTTAPPSEATTPPANGPIFDCSKDGTFRDSTNCSKFFVCSGGRIFPFECPQGLMYDILSSVCDWETNVAC